MNKRRNFSSLSGRIPLVFAVTLFFTSCPTNFKVFSQSCTREPLTKMFIVESGKTPNRKASSPKKNPQAMPVLAAIERIEVNPVTVPAQNQPQQTPAAASSPPSPEGSASRGKRLFDEKCSGCHTIGGGSLIGADLKGVTERLPWDWLINFTVHPDKMYDEKDPIAARLLKESGMKMPDMGVSKDEAVDIFTYLENPESMGETTPRPRQTPPPAQPAPPPTAQQGFLLFSGNVPLQNGGIYCKACHNIGGLSFPYGGRLGPSLSGIYQKLGPQGLQAALQNMPYPTMQPIYYPRPLTANEINNLIAFFQDAGGKQAPSASLLVGLPMAGGGFVLGMIAMWFIWHKRIKSVRKRLVARLASTSRGILS